MHINQLLTFQHVILLQGPVGPFFSNLAHYLRRQNPSIKITKINFCFGDQLFFSPPPNTSVIPFTQKIESFPSTLTNLLLLPENLNLSTAIALFGDCRPYHLMAFDTIKNLPPTSTTPQLVTFEEGYIRPQYFTMEFGRVNGFSEPVSPSHPPKKTILPDPQPLPLQKAKKYMILHGVRFALANALLNPFKYPSYKSWRDMPLAHTTLKAITFLFKYHLLQKNAATNRRIFSWSQKNPKQYFILALQLAHDSQIKHHSDSSQEAFLSHSLRSFASFAPPNHHLIIKAHPLDIDPDYWHSQIIEQVYDLNLQHRVHFITDSPNTLSLLSNASGLLCINSTLAISALELNIPSFPYGRAIYKLPQLTPSPSLHAFFQHPQPPNPLFFSSWKQTLIHRNQIPGNVYLPAHTLHSLYNRTA